MKKFICLLFIFLVVSLSSCSHIEDTNGIDNYSIQTFTDEDIIRGRSNTNSLGVLEAYSYIDNVLKGSYKVSKFSGIETINEYSSNDSYIKFDINFICESGNGVFAIVSDNEIVKKIEANQELIFEVSNNYKEYMLVIVGESGKLSLKYNISSY